MCTKNVDLTKLSALGLSKEQVIVFNDSELDKLYGKINDSIASYKKNPQKIKEYYEKRKKQKRIKIAISAIAGSVFVLVMIAYIVQPQLHIEEKYVFEKSWGTLDKDNLEFLNPAGVAIDSKGNLYVADTKNNRIQKIQPDGNITSIGNGYDIGQFYYPSGVAVDSKGNLYVAEIGNDRIQKIQPDGNITIIGKEGSKLGEFSNPTGVAVDNNGNLYVADTFNHRIQKFALSHIWKFEFGNTN